MSSTDTTPTTWTEDEARDAYWDRRQARRETILDDEPTPTPASNDEQLTLEIGA